MADRKRPPKSKKTSEESSKELARALHKQFKTEAFSLRLTTVPEEGEGGDTSPDEFNTSDSESEGESGEENIGEGDCDTSI